MFVEWDLFRAASSSTSYDFVITATVLICIHLLIEKIVLNNASKGESNILV